VYIFFTQNGQCKDNDVIYVLYVKSPLLRNISVEIGIGIVVKQTAPSLCVLVQNKLLLL